ADAAARGSPGRQPALLVRRRSGARPDRAGAERRHPAVVGRPAGDAATVAPGGTRAAAPRGPLAGPVAAVRPRQGPADVTPWPDRVRRRRSAAVLPGRGTAALVRGL